MSALISIREKRTGSEVFGLRPDLVRPSMGTSDEANAIKNSFEEIEKFQNWDRPSAKFASFKLRSTGEKSLKEKLFDSLVSVKTMTSQIAMHLDKDWRTRLFTQLDDLLDIDDWHEDDEPVKETSFGTFLRMIIHQDPKRRPGFGVSHKGFLIAAWTSGKDKLTLEYLPSDMIRWVLSCEIEGECERAAGETPVWRLPEVLKAYRPERWFLDANY